MNTTAISTSPPTQPSGGRDTRILFGRTLRHVLASPDTIVTTAIVPIAILLMFVYVFGGAIDAGDVDYVNYLMPGVLLITVASGIAYTAVRVYTDVSSGIVERFWSMPISRPAVLWAHVAVSVVATVISLGLVVAVGIAIGFRPSASVPDWAAIAGILTLFTVALTWLAVAAGLSASSAEGASAFSYPLVFLPFVSSAFVPTDTMPTPVKSFAEHQPVTAIVDTIRNLYQQQPVGTEIWVALAWCVGLLVVAYGLALVVFRRRLA